MRQSIVLAAVIALAATAGEAAAQSRYGPRPATLAAADVPADMPPTALLTWKGKPTPVAAVQQEEARAPERPEPLAPWAQRMAAAAPAPAAPLPEPAGPALPAPAPQPQSQPQAAPRPLPTSLYDAPAPTHAAAPAKPAPQQHAAPQARPQTAQPQTALLGAAPAPRPTPPAPPASAYDAPAGPRFYSVFREYGVSPDQIPVAPAPVSGGEVKLSEVPQTPSLASPDDTQYIPPRTNQSGAAANRTF